MKSIKIFVLTFIFCFISTVVASAANNSAYSGAIINLKNGQKMECMVLNNSVFSKKVLYRLSSNSKDETLSPSEILSIVVPDEEGRVSVIENLLYVESNNYIKGNYSKTKNMMMSVVEYGPISLFCYTINMYQNGVLISIQHRYACRKDDSDYGIELGLVVENKKPFGNKFYTQTKSKFDKMYEKLFGDYPELCQQIRDKKLKFENIEDIVHEYNVHKAETKSDKE